MGCQCYYCQNDIPHPAAHGKWEPVSHKLLKAESLNPSDSVPMIACQTCGHEEEAPTKCLFSRLNKGGDAAITFCGQMLNWPACRDIGSVTQDVTQCNCPRCLQEVENLQKGPWPLKEY